ncbi:hypothetical protein IV203_006472 [Nitzschia inconspicua]|uniref:RING-type domain-containing protein n=1 Tax=Nitzschia inconspicua TaxID=303405 RepID=A0A9K3KBT3_9STRA|nr:hypothetical protein IV203_006472 [Nitzschia inconspicua]
MISSPPPPTLQGDETETTPLLLSPPSTAMLLPSLSRHHHRHHHHHHYGSTIGDNGNENNHDNSTAVVETISSSSSSSNSETDSPATTLPSTQQQQQQHHRAEGATTTSISPALSPTEDEDNGSSTDGNEEEEESRVSALTRRLRCLFSTITWPIVPLGTIVALALLWVLYAASSLDLRRSCSHPLHWYALASLALVAYIPFHAQARSRLFSYHRERDGPIRPARVRMFDQFFHTVCLLYVYTGVTLIQTCREDMATENNTTTTDDATTTVTADAVIADDDGPINTCQATCPNLYQALSVYVATLEIFTFALILPLLFLPCIYLWFLRRATAEAEAFAQLQDRLQEEEALLGNGGVTAKEIMDSLENVKLVLRKEARSSSTNNNDNNSSDINNNSNVNDTSTGDLTEDQEIWLLPYSATDASIGMKSDVKECCICMSDFPIHNEADLEDGLFQDNNNNHNQCRHNNNQHDLLKECIIVRTRCGHVFHKECLSGWVGGRWQLHATTGVSNHSSSNHNSNNLNSTTTDDSNNTATTPERRRRRARQTCCPLCREDLRPSSMRTSGSGN